MADQNDNHKKLVKGAKETEAWYKHFADHASDLAQCVDSEGRFIYVNQAWLSALKFAAEEIDNITLRDIIHPDSMEQYKAIFEQSLTGKAYGAVEAVFAAKDGTPVMVEGNVDVKFDESGRFVHTYGIFRDVTAHKQMEEHLQMQNKAMRSLISRAKLLEVDLQQMVADITETTSILSGAERVSVWLCSEDGAEICCIDLFQQSDGRHTSGKTLRSADFPTYISTLQKGEAIAAADVYSDLSTCELPEAYYREHDIRSLLDTPIWLRDRVHGILSIEHVGKQRTWTLEDVRMAAEVAAILSLYFETDERKHAEEALRKQEEDLRTTLSSIGDAVIATCTGGYVTRMNPVAEKLTGWPHADAVGRPLEEIFRIVNSRTRVAVKNPVRRALRIGTTVGLGNHTLLLSRDGSEYQIADSASPICDDQGTITGVVLVFRDVTREYKLQQNLRESEEQYRTLYKNIPIGVYRNTPGPEGRILMANPGFMKIFGIKSYEELAQLKVKDLYQDPAERASFSERLIAEGHVKGVERRLKRLDGTPIWGSVTVQAVYNEDGEAAWFDCTIEDITRRKEAEEALKASEQKHREILAAIAEGYYEVDLTGNLVFFNDSFRQMTGLSSEELIGKSYKQFYKNPEEVFKTFNQVYQTGNPVTAGDWPAVNQDGREAFMELSISLRYDENGQPIGFRGIVRDITERRQTEEKIRYLSYHDQLTGLYNRHFLEEEMKRLDTDRQLPISIIMADLNGLKLVNDTYGHQTGDEMLKKAAAILENTCRNEDLIARFGGDEFVLYLPRTSEAEARKIIGRIEEACRDEQISDLPLSLSTGLAVKVNAEQKLSAVLKAAEDKMYQEKLTESRSGKSAIVNTLLQTLAEKSYETEAHTRNMQETASKIGKKLGLSGSELHRLNLLITLHDIGKTSIPEELLNKQEALTGAEWEIMKKHCEIGFRIVRATEEFAYVADDILAHHERWDGSGYPQGLKGNAIPLLARITAIVDAYEVMSNGRPYKQALSRSEIVAEFKKCSGTQFDPKLVELWLAILEADG